MNLSGFQSQQPATNQPVAPQGGGMINLNMKKGMSLDLNKRMNKCVFAGGWDVTKTNGFDADLDLCAFMLHTDGKIHSADDIIYFNHMRADGIMLEGDNRTGEGEGDDERIDIDFSRLPVDVTQIVLAISIFEARERQQTFGMVRNAFVRLLSADGIETEVARYNLSDDYAASTSVIVSSLTKSENGWSFKAEGEGINGTIETIANMFC